MATETHWCEVFATTLYKHAELFLNCAWHCAQLIELSVRNSVLVSRGFDQLRHVYHVLTSQLTSLSNAVSYNDGTLKRGASLRTSDSTTRSAVVDAPVNLALPVRRTHPLLQKCSSIPNDGSSHEPVLQIPLLPIKPRLKNQVKSEMEVISSH